MACGPWSDVFDMFLAPTVPVKEVWHLSNGKKLHTYAHPVHQDTVLHICTARSTTCATEQSSRTGPFIDGEQSRDRTAPQHTASSGQPLPIATASAQPVAADPARARNRSCCLGLTGLAPLTVPDRPSQAVCSGPLRRWGSERRRLALSQRNAHARDNLARRR